MSNRVLNALDRGIDHLLARLEWLSLRLARLRRRMAPVARVVSRMADRVRARPLVWGTVYVLAFCLVSCALFDRPVAWAFKAHMAGEWEGFFKIVTKAGVAAVYLWPSALLAAAFFLAARRALSPGERALWRARAWAPGFVFLAVAGSGLTGDLIKVVAGRLRPRLLFENGLYGFSPFSHDWAMNSFPSGHSQAVWAAMTALTILYPRHRSLALTIAVLVSLSRVATTVHYLSDVVAGAWLGVAGALITAKLLRDRGVCSINSPL